MPTPNMSVLTPPLDLDSRPAVGPGRAPIRRQRLGHPDCRGPHPPSGAAGCSSPWSGARSAVCRRGFPGYRGDGGQQRREQHDHQRDEGPVHALFEETGSRPDAAAVAGGNRRRRGSQGRFRCSHHGPCRGVGGHSRGGVAGGWRRDGAADRAAREGAAASGPAAGGATGCLAVEARGPRPAARAELPRGAGARDERGRGERG